MSGQTTLWPRSRKQSSWIRITPISSCTGRSRMRQTDNRNIQFCVFQSLNLFDVLSYDLWPRCRGQVYLLLDQMDQTVKNFSIAASLKPNFVSPNVQLAYTEFRCKRVVKIVLMSLGAFITLLIILSWNCILYREPLIMTDPALLRKSA